MKLIRNYFTSEELMGVVSVILSKETSVEREIIKVGLTMQILTDVEEEFEDNTEYYNYYMNQDFINFDTDVKNYKVIDELIASELSVEKTVKDFLDNLSVKLDKSFKKLPKDLKNFKMDEFIKSLKEVTSNASENN